MLTLHEKSKAVVSHYAEFVSNADFRYSCPPADDSQSYCATPSVEQDPLSTELYCNPD